MQAPDRAPRDYGNTNRSQQLDFSRIPGRSRGGDNAGDRAESRELRRQRGITMSTHIIVADDHPLFRNAITHLLQRSLPGVAVTQVESIEGLSREITDKPLPSLVLLDLKLSDSQGMDGLLFLKKQYPSLPVLIISAYDDEAVVGRAMQYGASGFVPKSLEMDRMAEVIRAVLDGDMWFPEISGSIRGAGDPKSHLDALTPAQLKVLALLRDGRPSKEMASLMGVTEATIKAHLTEIFRKLKVRNRTQAVLAAKDLDLPGNDFPDPKK